MKSRNVRKIISFISSFSLVLQTFLPLTFALPVYAEDSTPSATVEPTAIPVPTLEPTATPTAEPTVIPTLEPTATPTIEPTPDIDPAITATPTAQPTTEPIVEPIADPTVEPTTTPTPAEIQNNSPPAEETTSFSKSTPSQTETSTVEVIPEPITIVSQLEQAITPEIKPTLTTDKLDYFPTDTVYITGTNFLPNTTYILHISSQDNPIFNYNPEITSDKNGSISHSFVLDSNYRPNYTIDALDVSGTIVASYSFTDSGPIANVATFSELNTALADVSVSTINITADITGISSSILVGRTVTIEGNGFTLSPTFEKNSNSNNATLAILSSNVTLNNLIVDGTLGTSLHGINIYMVNNILLDNVSVLNNDSAGIVVNGSIVTVNNITTASNGWGGINVDQGSGVTTEAKLIINGTSSHNEATQIWLDDTTKNVSVQDTHPKQYTYQDYGNKRVYTLKTAGNSSADLDQWGNEAPIGWQNGNLNGNQADYFEGDSVAYRMKFDNLSLSSHTVTIGWDTTKGGKHALDYLTSYDRTETTDPCSGVTGCTGPATTFTIPTDSNIPTDPNWTGSQIPGNFSLFGGTITSVSSYNLINSYSGDSETQITITFTASQNNPVLAWGGHIATRANWGQNNSAISISGSPYHMRLRGLDGSGGNQDRSLASEAVIYPATITIVKDAVPNSAQDFSFTTSGTELSIFSLDDDVSDTALSNTKVFSITNFVSNNGDTKTITEDPQGGWLLTGLVCNDNNGSVNLETRTATLSVVEGENLTCTFTNTQQNGTLRVNKITVPNEAEIFSVTATGSGTITGNATQNVTGGSYVDFTVTTGTYSVTESPKAGWSETENTCTNVSVPAGGMGECTITNSQRGSIFGYKYEDGNGDGQSGDWTPIQNWIIELWQGQTKVGQTQTLVNGYFSFTDLLRGEYTLTEQMPSGWTNVSTDFLNVSLSPGENDGPNNFVNTRYGTIVVEKQTLPDGDLQNFTFTGDLAGTIADGETISVINLLPGRYSSTEVLPDGWDLTSISCSDQNSSGNIDTGVATFNVESGETVRCTFTNTKRAHIIVKKNAIPDGSQVFTFNNNFGNGNPTTFNLADTTTTGLPNYNAEVLPGTYSVSENETTGWKQDSAVCNNGETIDSIDVAAGETVTCTFTNNKLSTITLVKNTVGGNGSFDFDATGVGLPADIDLTTVAGVASQSFNNLNPDNTYSIFENVPTGWDLTSATCDNGDSVSRITPNAGEEITCTFTNTKKGKIIIRKETNLDEDQTKFRFSSSYSDGKFYLSSGEQNDSGYLTPGTYSVKESSNEGDGWKLTSAVCSNEDTPDEITLGAGEEVTCTFTNEYTKPELQISKSNFAGGDKTPGSAVTYRILLKVLGSDIDGITVEDLLPKGFIYRPGSYQVKINGLIVDIDEPDYHSPGTWIIDYLVKAGQEVELLYTADISGDQQPGIYPDAAWAVGTSMAEEEVWALAQTDGYVDTNFVGTEVNVIKKQTRDDSYSVEKEEIKKGEVLGATTTLPATGASPAWLMLAFVCLVYGIRLIKSGNKK